MPPRPARTCTTLARTRCATSASSSASANPPILDMIVAPYLFRCGGRCAPVMAHALRPRESLSSQRPLRPLADDDGDLLRLTAAQDLRRGALAELVAAKLCPQRLRVGDRLAAQRQQQVADEQPSLLSGAARLHGRDQQRRLLGNAGPLRQRRRPPHLLRADATAAALDPAMPRQGIGDATQ